MPNDLKYSGYIKKDYQKKNFVNPFLNPKTRQGKFNTKLYLKIIVVILFFYVLIYSNLLKVTAVEIKGNDMISQDEFLVTINGYLDSFLWYLFPQRNMIFLRKVTLARNIERHFNLKKLEIKKSWKKINIVVEEKISHLIVYNTAKQEFFLADIDGVLIKQVDGNNVNELLKKFPTFNINDPEAKIGQSVASSKIIDFILKINNNLSNSLVEIRGYEKRGLNEVSLISKNGWQAYFDTNSDVKVATQNLLTVLNEKIKNQKVEYIDLRFGNKIFYK